MELKAGLIFNKAVIYPHYHTVGIQFFYSILQSTTAETGRHPIRYRRCAPIDNWGETNWKRGGQQKFREKSRLSVRSFDFYIRSL